MNIFVKIGTGIIAVVGMSIVHQLVVKKMVGEEIKKLKTDVIKDAEVEVKKIEESKSVQSELTGKFERIANELARIDNAELESVIKKIEAKEVSPEELVEGVKKAKQATELQSAILLCKELAAKNHADEIENKKFAAKLIKVQEESAKTLTETKTLHTKYKKLIANIHKVGQGSMVQSILKNVMNLIM